MSWKDPQTDYNIRIRTVSQFQELALYQSVNSHKTPTISNPALLEQSPFTRPATLTCWMGLEWSLLCSLVSHAMMLPWESPVTSVFSCANKQCEIIFFCSLYILSLWYPFVWGELSVAYFLRILVVAMSQRSTSPERRAHAKTFPLGDIDRADTCDLKGTTRAQFPLLTSHSLQLRSSLAVTT